MAAASALALTGLAVAGERNGLLPMTASGALALVALAVAAKEAYEYSVGHAGALDTRSVTLALTLFVIAASSAIHKKIRKKPVLAVDLDEVCCGYLPAYIDYSNATHGTHLELSDFSSYMFWQVPKAKLATREAATERVYAFHASEHFGRIEPIEGAASALALLATRFELHVVTSRQTDIEPQTRAFVADIVAE